MNVSIELPSDLGNELSAEASQLKLPLVDCILRVLSFCPFLQNPPQTGLDLVAYWETTGLINSQPDITDSQDHARRLRNEAGYRERRSP